MGAGKVLVIIGAILTLVSTFFLSLFSSIIPMAITYLEAGNVYGNGLSFFLHMIDMFTNAAGITAEWALIGVNIPVYMIYIVAVVLIIFAISGVLQLIGLKSRALAIIGSLLPLFIGTIILLNSFITLPDFLSVFPLFLIDNPLVDGIVPYDLILGPTSLGTYTLLAGGVLGLIGGIMGTKDF